MFVVEVILNDLWEKILVLGSSRNESDEDCVPRDGKILGNGLWGALSSTRSCQWTEVTLHKNHGQARCLSQEGQRESKASLSYSSKF